MHAARIYCSRRCEAFWHGSTTKILPTTRRATAPRIDAGAAKGDKGWAAPSLPPSRLLVASCSCLVEELTSHRDRAIQDLCPELRAAGHRQHQGVAVRGPGGDEL